VEHDSQRQPVVMLAEPDRELMRGLQAGLQQASRDLSALSERLVRTESRLEEQARASAAIFERLDRLEGRGATRALEMQSIKASLQVLQSAAVSGRRIRDGALSSFLGWAAAAIAAAAVVGLLAARG